MARTPSRDLTPVIQLGLKAHRLATDEGAIVPRLPAGFLDGLAADIAALGTLAAGARQAHLDATLATETQNAELDHAFQLVSAIRTAVRRAKPRPDVRRMYGVGHRLDPRSVTHLVVALSGLIDRATARPDEARDLGLLDRDVAELRELLATIRAANTRQETRRAKAPSSTKERDAAARRVLAAVSRIAGAGIVEFAHDPSKRAPFEALLEPPHRKPKSASRPAVPA